MTPEKIKESLDSLGYKLSDRGQYWQTNAIFRNGQISMFLDEGYLYAIYGELVGQRISKVW